MKIDFISLSGRQLLCFIAFDEVHVQPSLRLRGGHAVGHAYDELTKLARTVLSLIIQPLMGGHAFVARLVPVYKLTVSFLKELVELLIKLVHECGKKCPDVDLR